MKRICLLLLLFFTGLVINAQTKEQLSEWISKGKAAFVGGYYKEAIQHFGRLEKIFQEYDESLLQKSKDYGYFLYILAESYDKLENYPQAVEYGRRAVDIYKTSLGENHPDYATLLNNLAGYYYNLGDYSKAVEYETKAMEIRKAVLGENHPDYANSLLSVVIYYYALGDYSKVMEYGTKAIGIYKGSLGEKDSFYASTLGLLAKCSSKIGNYSKAVEYGTKEAEIKKEVLGENHPYYATSLGNLACYYSEVGEYLKAVEYERKAIEIRKAIYGEKHPDYSKTLGNLASYYSDLGDHSKAIEFGIKAMEIDKAVLGENHPDYATSLDNLALDYSDLGDYSKAIDYGTQAMKIRKAIYGENHPVYANSLGNLAHHYANLNDYSKAVEYGTKAMEIDKAVLGENHPDYATLLSNLAYYNSELGNYSKTMDYEIQAMEIRKAKYGENHPEYAKSLSNLADYFSDLGDNSKALDYGTQAMKIRKDVLGENHPYYARSLGKLAHYYSDLGDYSKAAEYTKKNIVIDKNNILSVFSNFPSSQRSLYWNKYSAVFTDKYPAILFKSSNYETSDLYNQSALFPKGLLLSTITEMNKLILESGDKEALRMFEELRLKRMELHRLYERPITERLVNLDSLKTVADLLEKKLVERSKVYGDYTKKLQTTWQDVQLSLAADELAVEFLSFHIYGTDSTMVAALTLRKDDTEPKFFPLFELKQLKELSDTAHFICPNLTNLVWQPLQNKLQGIKTIYFSPAGVLHKIGIEYAPGMESYEIFRLSSTREIIDMKATINTTEKWSASLYGGINYESLSPTMSVNPVENKSVTEASLFQHRSMVDSLDLRGKQIEYLPGTLKEVQNIQKYLTDTHHNTTIYTGTEATETSVKSLSGKTTSILHISTHGFYYTESQARKKENLRFLSFEDKHNSSYEDKSLTRSGLLMAGAKLTIDGKDVPIDADDGILTAQEISQLDLRGIDFVALSACETGMGDIVKGEGVFGLQRGFKKAGVKTILMSLWRVSDVSTEMLMTEFYKNLCNGKSKRESLRLAQKIIREYKDEEGNLLFQDPHYWAGFIMLD